jgi:electron transport complex protein RnfG
VAKDANGKPYIKGLRLLQDKDTPGLGARASDARYFIDKPANKTTFYGQYAGKPLGSGTLKVKKDGGTIDAITGATITSRAVTLLADTAGRAGEALLK